jgi:hypothetical protein
VINPITADTGYNVVSDIYMESHVGTETATDNCAVVISCPTGQTGFNRLNVVENVAISTGLPGPGLFMVTNDEGTLGKVSNNTFRGQRRNYIADTITIGADVDGTSLWLTPAAGEAPEVNDSGTRTYINGSIGVDAGSGPSLNAAAGQWWSYPAAHGTGVTINGALYLHPVYVPRTLTIDRIACEVTTGAASSVIHQVIYETNPQTGLPDALLLDIGATVGTVDGNAIAITEQTISQKLVGGRLYWLGALVLGCTPSMRVLSSTGTSWSGQQASSANALGAGASRQGRVRTGLASVPATAGTMSVSTGATLAAVRVV